MRYLLTTVTILAVVCLVSTSQTIPILHDPPATGVTGYNESIPKPESVLGYRIGEKHTRHHLIVDYFQKVAASSERVVYGEHGRTYDGRLLIHAVVTSPENHTQIGEIKENNLKLVNNPEAVSDSDIADLPAIIWMGYGVHGNEASSFEAAMLLLYHLAAGEGDELERMLDDLVILVIPSLNPDGHARHVNWVNKNRGTIPTTDPQHREHNEPWPGGRTNYFWFDLNRDWFPIQHPESRGRIKLFNEWRPQLVTDFHEFGSHATYFFQPGVPSRYNPNIPEKSINLLKDVGEFHASALDERGVLYYTRETFDDFYIGKGSTYPMVRGAIGILFEQASSRALRRETQRGELTFDFSILNQFTTSLSTLSASYSLREELLRNFRQSYRTAGEYARQSGIRAFIIDSQTDRTRTQELTRILQSHNIRMYELAEDVSVEGQQFSVGQAVVIPTEQPEARLILAALERRTEFADSLFYDVSTWTLPLAFNLPYAEYRRNPNSLLGAEIDAIRFDGGIVNGGRASYAYALEWDRYYSPRALYRLQENDVQTIVSMRPFDAIVNGEERSFSRGTIIIPVSQQKISDDQLYDFVRTIAKQDYVKIHSMQSSRTIEGPDLGSPAMRVLPKPTVALLAGRGTSSGEVGEIWHLLNERMHMPVTLLNISELDSRNLDDYTTLIMVNGNYNTLSVSGLEKIKTWVRQGGVLITTKGASRLAAENDILSIGTNEFEPDLDDITYEDTWSARGAHRIGGAIFEARFDTTHPLAFGYRERVPLFRNHQTVFEVAESPGETVATYTEEPLLSGYISDEQLNELKGTAALVAQRFDTGRVVAFADNPNFRAFWYGTNRLFLNAIFFGGIF